jgi:hypothetical protein
MPRLNSAYRLLSVPTPSTGDTVLAVTIEACAPVNAAQPNSSLTVELHLHIADIVLVLCGCRGAHEPCNQSTFHLLTRPKDRRRNKTTHTVERTAPSLRYHTSPHSEHRIHDKAAHPQRGALEVGFLLFAHTTAPSPTLFAYRKPVFSRLLRSMLARHSPIVDLSRNDAASLVRNSTAGSLIPTALSSADPPIFAVDRCWMERARQAVDSLALRGGILVNYNLPLVANDAPFTPGCCPPTALVTGSPHAHRHRYPWPSMRRLTVHEAEHASWHAGDRVIVQSAQAAPHYSLLRILEAVAAANAHIVLTIDTRTATRTAAIIIAELCPHDRVTKLSTRLAHWYATMADPLADTERAQAVIAAQVHVDVSTDIPHSVGVVVAQTGSIIYTTPAGVQAFIDAGYRFYTGFYATAISPEDAVCRLATGTAKVLMACTYPPTYITACTYNSHGWTVVVDLETTAERISVSMPPPVIASEAVHATGHEHALCRPFAGETQGSATHAVTNLVTLAPDLAVIIAVSSSRD